MKKYKYSLMVFIGLILWVAETAFFGFNVEAQSFAEHFLDTISWVFIIWGVLGDLGQNLNIQRITNVHAKEVRVNEVEKVNRKGGVSND